MTRPFPFRSAAAVLAAAAITVLAGCTAQPGTAPASGTTAAPASVQGFVCPTRAEVAGLTAIPFNDALPSGKSCTYTTAADASTVATVTLRHPAGASGETLSALRYAAIGRGASTADARAITFDAFTSTTKEDCTVWFPASDGVASSVTARRAGETGSEACGIATAVATLAGSATPKAAAPTVAVIAPRTLLGATTTTERWPWRIAQRTTARIDRLTGTGYLAPSSASSFATIAAGVPSDSSAVVFVTGTAEAGASTLAMLRGATSALSAAATRAPKAQLIVVRPVSDGTESYAEVERLGADLRAAAKIAGARYVDPTDPATTTGVADAVAVALRSTGVTAG